MTKWDLSFISEEEDVWGEPCPECACETPVKLDGTSTCEHCGHKEVLPCLACRDCNTQCDWNKETRCTPFPKEKS